MGERFDRLEDACQVVLGLWGTPVGERFSFSGRHTTIVDSPGLPKPVQQPHPPLILGGGGPRRTPRLAATYADEFNAFQPVDGARAAFARVREACEAIGRDPSTLTLSVATNVVCGRDEAEVARRAVATGQSPEQLRRRGQSIGTPDEVVEGLRAYAAVGATRAYLQVMDQTDLDHLRLLGAEVLPHL
jgi:alkanesulfonate monooxygenase SsuD/methylene tetrahydromethanopterin reductase-like flavin-dependent oxidoreductase (luciferase family)